MSNNNSPVFEHTVGSHSDDRGGDADLRCTCQDDKVNNNSGKVELDGNIIAVPTTYSNCERCGRSLPSYAVCLCAEKIYSQKEVDDIISSKVNEGELIARIDELEHMENEMWYREGGTTIGTRTERMPELKAELDQLSKENNV